MTPRFLPTLLALWLGCSPTLEEGRTAGDCTDAADNDGDGIFDCDDDGCAASPECVSDDSGDTDATLDEGRSAGDCTDGADNDGDGAFDCDDAGCTASPDCQAPEDADADGYTTDEGDCNDNDAAVYPGRVETCATEADDDCDGNPNEQDAQDCVVFYADADGDGYGDPVVGRCRCSAAGGEVDDNTDSDDTDPAVH
jgi:hypothetical protein